MASSPTAYQLLHLRQITDLLSSNGGDDTCPMRFFMIIQSYFVKHVDIKDSVNVELVEWRAFQAEPNQGLRLGSDVL